MVRPLSSGKQDYEADESAWPVGQPMTKIGAELQVKEIAHIFVDSTLKRTCHLDEVFVTGCPESCQNDNF